LQIKKISEIKYFVRQKPFQEEKENKKEKRQGIIKNRINRINERQVNHKKMEIINKHRNIGTERERERKREREV
jgi:hypothetical protein